MAGADQARRAHPDEQRRDDRTNRRVGHDVAGESGGEDRRGDRQRVPGTERRQRAPQRAAPLLLHAERHGKQPPHPGVDAVKRAERRQSEERRHEKQ
jgi:hypothetical protein